MPNVALYDITGKVIGDIELSENVFGQPVNEPVLHQVVVAHLANCRQGTQSAKTRSEVSGGGKKPYRQKGTGRARQGSTRAPQWTHGGVVFAPKPRDYTQKVNAKVKRIALKSALSSKVADSAAHFQALHNAEKIMMEDYANIPVAYYTDFWLQSSTLKGVWHSPYGYWYLQYAYIG